MTPLEELQTMQAWAEVQVSDDSHALRDRMTHAAAYMARAGHIRDEAALELAKAKRTAFGQVPDGCTPTEIKMRVEAATFNEKYLVDRAETLLDSLGKVFDAAQSSLSFLKEELRRLA